MPVTKTVTWVNTSRNSATGNHDNFLQYLSWITVEGDICECDEDRQINSEN